VYQLQLVWLLQSTQLPAWHTGHCPIAVIVSVAFKAALPVTSEILLQSAKVLPGPVYQPHCVSFWQTKQVDDSHWPQAVAKRATKTNARIQGFVVVVLLK
jgi:hypothetical protein